MGYYEYLWKGRLLMATCQILKLSKLPLIPQKHSLSKISLRW
jgi:hypothetical protein